MRASMTLIKSYRISQDRVGGPKGDTHRSPAQLHRRAVSVGSDLVMVKALYICGPNGNSYANLISGRL